MTIAANVSQFAGQPIRMVGAAVGIRICATVVGRELGFDRDCATVARGLA
jgi:low affinity Fe/Cu permease